MTAIFENGFYIYNVHMKGFNYFSFRIAHIKRYSKIEKFIVNKIL
jgi:hypothetical protein